MVPKLTILDDPFPANLVAVAYDIFRELVIPPSFFYLSLDTLRAGKAASSLAAYLPQPVAGYLSRHLGFLTEVCHAESLGAADGFELWLGMTVRGGDSAYVHVDNDEMLRGRTGVVRCPLLGTIFHLGPARGLVGGDTVFDLDPQEDIDGRHVFVREPWEAILTRFSAPVVVPRRSGRLILFRGDLPHAVAPILRCNPSEPRVALLANLWDRRISSVPEGVAALPPGEFHRINGG